MGRSIPTVENDDTGVRPKVDYGYMYLAFHKGLPKHKKGHFISSVIKWWTKEDYSHVELVFPSATNKEIGLSFSSRGSDDPSGVRFKQITYTHPERWTFVPIYFTGDDVTAMYNHAIEHVGQKYGYLDLFTTFVIKSKLNNKKRWFCSEICSHLIGVDRSAINPGELFRYSLNLSNNVAYNFDEKGNIVNG